MSEQIPKPDDSEDKTPDKTSKVLHYVPEKGILSLPYDQDDPFHRFFSPFFEPPLQMKREQESDPKDKSTSPRKDHHRS